MGRQSQKWVRMHELRNFAGLRSTTKLLRQTLLFLTFWPQMWPKFHPCRCWSDPHKLRPHSRPDSLQKKVLQRTFHKIHNFFSCNQQNLPFLLFLFCMHRDPRPGSCVNPSMFLLFGLSGVPSHRPKTRAPPSRDIIGGGIESTEGILRRNIVGLSPRARGATVAEMGQNA